MKFVVADSGQIEPRVTAWLAGHKTMLDLFRKNDALGEKGDLYSDVGTTIYGRPISKKETPVERQASKSAVIGLGYQMGGMKFADYLLKGNPPVKFTEEDAEKMGMNIAPYIHSGEKWAAAFRARVETMVSRVPFDERLIHCAVTDGFVKRYRDSNPPLIDLWDEMGEMIRAMAEGEEKAFGYNGVLTTHRHGVTKPGGLSLHYNGLEWYEGEGNKRGFYRYLGGRSGKEWQHFYGGKATENMVQSLARDIVDEQALWVRANGYFIVTKTHDEIVALAPDDKAEECLAMMLDVMRTPPEWCADLPLNATGSIGDSYGDAK